MYGVTTFTYKFIRELVDGINVGDGTTPDRVSRAWAIEQSLKDINKHDDKIEDAARHLAQKAASLTRDLGEIKGHLEVPSPMEMADLSAAILGRQQAWTMLRLVLDSDQMEEVVKEAKENRRPK